MAIIYQLMQSADGLRVFMSPEQGEIYKGYGIITSLSAGRQVPFCIHLNTGRIIPSLSENTKTKIDKIEDVIDPNWEYERICKITNEYEDILENL